MENSSAIPQKIKHRGPSNFTPIPKRNENLHPHKNLYIDVHNSIIYNGHKIGNLNPHQLMKNILWSTHTMKYHSAIRGMSTDTRCTTDTP